MILFDSLSWLGSPSRRSPCQSSLNGVRLRNAERVEEFRRLSLKFLKVLEAELTIENERRFPVDK